MTAGNTYSGNNSSLVQNQALPFERIPSLDSITTTGEADYVNYDSHTLASSQGSQLGLANHTRDDSQRYIRTEAPPTGDYLTPIITHKAAAPKPDEDFMTEEGEEEGEELYDTVSSLNRVRTFVTPRAFVKRSPPTEDTPLTSEGNSEMDDDGELYEVMGPLQQQLPPGERDSEHPDESEDMYVCVNEY